MGRIRMPAARSGAGQLTFAEAFEQFVADSAARGLAEKTLKTYRNHLHCVSLHLDIETPLATLTREQLNKMVVSMRSAGLAANTISSYTRVVKTFLNWCGERHYCNIEMPQYKAEETIKDTYTDDECQTQSPS